MRRDFDIGIHCQHFLSMSGGEARPESEIFVGIRNGKIAEVSPWSADKKAAAKEFIDGSRQALMPGLINGHAHLAMTLFKGLEDDSPFHHWLFERILPLEGKLVDADFVRMGTELAALECIRFGVTSMADMYFFSETVADVLDRSGLRGWISQPWSKGPNPENRVLGTDKVKTFEKLIEKYGKHERITVALGPHSPYLCSDEILREVRETATRFDAPIHIHLCETKQEVESSMKEFGVTPVRRLYDLGILSPKTLAAHCVHLNDDDIGLMKKSGTSVSYNPDSNLKLSSGIAPITKYRAEGIPVALGTDGSASNNDLSLFGAMDLGTKLQKLISGDNTAMVAADALRLATWEGARALGIQDRVGSIEVGKDADLILIGLDHPHLQPIHDLRSQLVYSVQGLEVETVLCKGRILMKNRNILALDETKTLREAEGMRERIRNALKELA